jgi:magnesium-transporting ATPase (P-type)
VAAGIVNLIIIYFTLRSDGKVPLFAAVADIWNHSLIGALIPRSIVISLIITITTVYTTAKEASSHSLEIASRLQKTPWIKMALRKALFRALIAFIFVILLAYVLRMFFPIYSELSVSLVIPIVGLFAAFIAFSMTYAAVLSTGKILEEGSKD